MTAHLRNIGLRLISAIALSLLAACAPQSGTGQVSVSATPAAPAEFRLGAGDQIHVDVFGADKISGDYTIDVSGGLTLPLAGTIKAQGITPTDLSAQIGTALRAQHLIANPQVSINIVSARPWYILGSVDKAGEYPYKAGLNIVSAVATAGGFSYRADQDFVFIRRGGQGPEEKVPFASAAPIFPGDIIRVPDRSF